MLIFIIAGSASAWDLLHKTPAKRVSNSLVPVNIQKSVSYKIYYPDPNKLPTGYYLDTSTFTNNSSAVIYAIRYDSGHKKVLVANQPKPTGDIISNFESKTIPLHFTYKTPIGTAAIGAITPNSVTSLSTNSDVWLIITAPSDINQGQLEAVLNSLRT